MRDPRKGKPSASRMHRVCHCPGSVLAEALAPKGKSTKVADAGTEIHDALADDDFESLGEDERVIAERLVEMKAKALEAFKVATGSKDVNEFREKRYWIKSPKGDPICSAQLDVAYVAGDKALVIDTKTGYKEVTPAQSNWQIKTQAVAFWRANPKVKEVWGAVASFRFREQYTSVRYTLSDLLRTERDVRFVLWRAEQENAERVPGSWCDFCSAKAFCREAGAYSLLPVPVFNEAPDGKIKERALAAVETMGLEDLAMLAEKRSIINHVLDSVSARLKTYTQEELQSVGLKKQTRPRYNIEDVNGLLSMFVKLGLLEKKECAGVCNVVLARLMEIATPRLLKQMEKEGGIKKGDAVERLKKVISPFQQKFEYDVIAPLTQQERKKLQEANEHDEDCHR